MQISDHYVPYPKKTAIVLTNNEKARLCVALDREIEEVGILEVSTEIPTVRGGGTSKMAPADTDEMKAHSRRELYTAVSDELMRWLQDKKVETIYLCAPEIYKNEIGEAMHTDVMKHVAEVVPKNLCSLPLDQVIRILQESRE